MRTKLAIAAIITTLAGAATPALADQVSVGFNWASGSDRPITSRVVVAQPVVVRQPVVDVRYQRPYTQTGYSDGRFSDGGGYHPVIVQDRCPAPGQIRELRREQQISMRQETDRLRFKLDRRSRMERSRLEWKIRSRYVSPYEAQRARANLDRELQFRDQADMANLDRAFDQRFQREMANLFRSCRDGRRDGLAGRFDLGDNYVANSGASFYY